MREEIVLVDTNGKPIGVAEKFSSHHANTPLHRAFSCYVFDPEGRFLFTQRAKSKKVWPGVWTNTVCGHPAPGESVVDAIKRRLKYELGMTAEHFTEILPDYRYKTPPFKGIIENEVCPVYAAIVKTMPSPNPAEVEDMKWIAWQDYVKRATADDPELSYWCKDQMKQLERSPVLKKFLSKHCS